MSYIAFTRSIRAQVTKAPPTTVVIMAISLIVLTYYGVMLILASAPHFQALDRTTFLQSEQIKQLSAELAALKRQNEEMRESISASHERTTKRSANRK